MWKRIKDLIGNQKPSESKQPPNRYNPYGIITTLFRRRKEEIITVEFLIDASCYDTAHDYCHAFFPQTIKAGKYELVKTAINEECHDNLYWYLFRGETRGLTELTLHRLIEKGVARIIKNPGER